MSHFLRYFLSSFALKLSITLALLAFVPMTVMWVYFGSSLRETTREMAYRSLETAALKTSLRIDAFLRNNLEIAEVSARLPSFSEFLKERSAPSRKNRYAPTLDHLKGILSQDKIFIQSVALLDLDGTVVADTDPKNLDSSEALFPFFFLPLRTGLPTVSDVLFSYQNSPHLFFSSVIYDGNKPVGILRISYSANILQHILVQDEGFVGKGSFPVLLDSHDILLASGGYGHGISSPSSQIFGSPSPSFLASLQDQKLLPPSFNPALHAHPAIPEGEKNPNRTRLSIPQSFDAENASPKEMVIALSPLDIVPWKVGFLQSESAFNSEVESQLYHMLAIATAFSLLLLPVIYYVSRLFTQSISDLQKSVLAIGSGDLDTRVEVRSLDEIGQFASTLNTMVQRIQAREQDLKNAISQAERANQAKSEFLAVMSHEIRTPLNPVIGLSSLMLEEKLSSEHKEYLGIIHNSASILLTLINDILDFSKIESGLMSLEQTPFSVSDAVSEVLQLLGPQAQTKQLALIYSASRDLPTSVQGDPYRFRQIVTNLVSNAIKFTSSGGVVVSFSATLSPSHPSPPTAKISFRIEDTGIGISQEAREKLFKPFSQGDSSTTRKYGGTGLGLKICQKLLAAMGGKIWESKKEDRGSCFEFFLTLPIAPASPFPPPQLQQLPASPKCAIVHLRDPAVAAGVELVLENLGIPSVSFAKTGLKKGDLFVSDIPEWLPPTSRSVFLSCSPSPLPPANPLHRACCYSPLDPCTLLSAIQTLFLTPASPSPSTPSEKNSPRPISSTRILVAEDNPANQQTLLLMLSKLGYRADLSPDGSDALQRLHLHTYDILLADIDMPKMNGIELAERIRSSNSPSSKELRIIAVTANAILETREHCIASGMNDYLAKPFRQQDLERILKRWDPNPPPPLP